MFRSTLVATVKVRDRKISLRPTTQCETLTILIGSQQAAPYDCINLINLDTALSLQKMETEPLPIKQWISVCVQGWFVPSTQVAAAAKPRWSLQTSAPVKTEPQDIFWSEDGSLPVWPVFGAKNDITTMYLRFIKETNNSKKADFWLWHLQSNLQFGRVKL